MKLVRKTNGHYGEFPTLFDDFFGKSLNDWFLTNYSDMGSTLPAVNIRENTDQFEVEVAAPGMNKKDFRIELDNDVLTISTEKQENQEENTGGYYRKEFGYRSFQRCFRLPKDVVNSEKIKAMYQDGILKIELPKREEVKPKPSRTIQVG